jgi:hypothetical protein
LCPIEARWDDLKSEFALDIELEQIGDAHYLGKRMYVMRIGCLCERPSKEILLGDRLETKEAKSNSSS